MYRNCGKSSWLLVSDQPDLALVTTGKRSNKRKIHLLLSHLLYPFLSLSPPSLHSFSLYNFAFERVYIHTSCFKLSNFYKILNTALKIYFAYLKSKGIEGYGNGEPEGSLFSWLIPQIPAVDRVGQDQRQKPQTQRQPNWVICCSFHRHIIRKQEPRHNHRHWNQQPDMECQQQLTPAVPQCLLLTSNLIVNLTH